MTQRLPQVPSSVVEIRGQQAFTTSLVLAEKCEIEHASVIKLIRKHQADFEEFGPCRFEIDVAVRKQGGGTPVEYAVLNEDQATYAITLFRNTAPVRRFKKTLVKEFRKALTEISRLQADPRFFSDPPRSEVLAAKRQAHHPMMDALLEWRESEGKETEARHFVNENLLCNWAVTGVWKPIDEKTLGNDDAALLEKVRRRNESMLMMEVPQKERKARLASFAIRWRTKRLGACGQDESARDPPPP